MDLDRVRIVETNRRVKTRRPIVQLRAERAGAERSVVGRRYTYFLRNFAWRKKTEERGKGEGGGGGEGGGKKRGKEP